jgi:hypothetical protein
MNGAAGNIDIMKFSADAAQQAEKPHQLRAFVVTII